MSKPWIVLTKYWHENSIGEQGEGPWIERSRWPTKAEAEAEAAKLRTYRASGGTWASVERDGDE